MPAIWSWCASGHRNLRPGVWHSHSSAPAPPVSLPLASSASVRPPSRSMMRSLRLVWLLLLVAASPAAAQQTQLVIRQLNFEGNDALRDEVLAAAIVTTNSSWFARAVPFRWLGLGAKRYFD